MADGQRPLFQITSKPGIQRDGTTLDSHSFTDGQWVRFYRGRPRKMGGYRSIVENLRYPPRGVFTFTKNNINSVYLFNAKGAQLLQVDNNLTGTLAFDVSPSGLTYNEDYLWQTTAIYDATGGGENLLIAHPGRNLSDISSSTNTSLYNIDAGDNTDTLAPIDDGSGGTIGVSGGVCVLQPYVFAYGNDGYIRNSNLNKPNDWTFGAGKDANEGNFSYTKIVKGLPIRGGGQSPAGLFWSLDSLIRVSYVGGASVFRYDPVGASTIMSSSGVAELDGYFFWMGLDRFYVYDGKVSELPNQMNINWVFDNLNFDQRQKVWATVVPRWGEVWWFFPFGQGQVECNRAVIFNTREKVWYDTEINRGCGAQVQTIRYPIWCGSSPARYEDASSAVTMTIANPGVLTWTSHNLQLDQKVLLSTTDTLPTGLLPGVVYYVSSIPSGNTFTLKASLLGTVIETTGVQAGVHTAFAEDTPRYIAYGHETGYNRVEQGQEVAIESYIETSDFGFPTGGAVGEQPTGQDYFTRLTRVEPDFVQTGDMTLQVIGNEFAQDNDPKVTSYTFGATATKVDTREQRRMIRLKFISNTVGGFFEMGRPLLHVEPGDIRS
jgi:hypothetical protein